MTDPGLAEALAIGREHLIAGRIGAAEALYEELVRRAPSSAEAHYGRGLVALRQSELARAFDALSTAVRLAPKIAAGHAKLGEALIGLERHTHAVAALRKSIALSSRDAEAHLHLGIALAALGDERDAQTCFKTARNLGPSVADEQLTRGRDAKERGHASQAVRHFRAALAVTPESAACHRELAGALRAAGRLEEASQHVERALELDASDVEAWLECGAVRLDANDPRRAEEAIARAIELAPAAAEPRVRNAILRYRCGEPARAEAECDRALAIEPEHVPAHVNRAFARLLQGKLREGFADFEWRKRRPGFRGSGLSIPEWDGAPLEGRTILLHIEQGLGDALQMARYAPLVEARGGRVVIGAPKELATLLRSVRGVRDVWSSLRPEDLSKIDFQCSLMSLPHLFETRLDSIPRDVPYVVADAARADRWRRELAGERRFKVGVVWAGSASNANDRRRSIELERFAPLAAADGVALFSLQKGAAAEELRAAAHAPIVDLAPKLADFADTAAALMHLDLLISVDTAACHLAGALGRPVWTLLPHAPDWRWMMERNDTPWYPTMRLFRQSAPADWSRVFDELRAELARAAHGQMS